MSRALQNLVTVRRAELARAQARHRQAKKAALEAMDVWNAACELRDSASAEVHQRHLEIRHRYRQKRTVRRLQQEQEEMSEVLRTADTMQHRAEQAHKGFKAAQRALDAAGEVVARAQRALEIAEARLAELVAAARDDALEAEDEETAELAAHGRDS